MAVVVAVKTGDAVLVASSVIVVLISGIDATFGVGVTAVVVIIGSG